MPERLGSTDVPVGRRPRSQRTGDCVGFEYSFGGFLNPIPSGSGESGDDGCGGGGGGGGAGFLWANIPPWAGRAREAVAAEAAAKAAPRGTGRSGWGLSIGVVLWRANARFDACVFAPKGGGNGGTEAMDGTAASADRAAIRALALASASEWARSRSASSSATAALARPAQMAAAVARVPVTRAEAASASRPPTAAWPRSSRAISSCWGWAAAGGSGGAQGNTGALAQAGPVGQRARGHQPLTSAPETIERGPGRRDVPGPCGLACG